MASDIDSNDVMIRLGVGALVLILAVVGWRVFHPKTVFAADGTDWRWDSAVEQSKASHQPALVLVTADWCPACRNLHANVLAQSQVRSEIDSHYTYLVLNMTNPTRAESERAQKLNITYFPTLIRYDRDGNESGRTNFLSQQAMLDWLREGE